VFPTLLYYITVTPDAEKCLFGYSHQIGAYRIGKTGLEEMWPLKNVKTAGDLYAVHPMDHRIWIGTGVLEFSSGRLLVDVKNRWGLDSPHSSVWVGAHRVAEIAYVNSRVAEEEGVSEKGVQIALWDAESGELAASVEAPDAAWLCASPDGLHVAEAGSDKRVRIRSAQTLEVEQEFRCHESALTGVAWHPTLPLLVTRARDGVIRVWNLGNFEKVEEFTSRAHGAARATDKYWYRLEMTADGRELSVYGLGGTLVFRPESFQVATPMK
jgi:WD40 repeat protein